MSDKYKELLEQIDKDKGLASKRKLLTIVSLIMLAMQFFGAQIVEANTFILKLSFTQQNGIGLLLCIAILFLLIRYYSYASSYHDQLFQLWSSRLLRDPILFLNNPHVPQPTGLIIDLAEKEVGDLTAYTYPEHNHISWRYYCGWFFSRSIIYSISDQYDSYDKKINLFSNTDVSFCLYFKILWCEFKHQTTSFIKHRENLDIYTPYFLASAAIGSYIFSAELQLLISQVSVLLH